MIAPGRAEGRQTERTVLAHWRTELAVVVTAMLVVRHAGSGIERIVIVPAALVAVVAVIGVGWHRQRRLGRGDSRASPAAILVTVVGVVVLQVAAVVVVL
ncbi:MAG: hypothetical protein ABW122_16720 [Ilumatobacteraceae bacterium]